MRAAIYSRFSTDKQTESSIADQVRVCTEYAEKHGLTVLQRFEDQGISGAAMGNRPGFLAMREAAKARLFDTLLVMDTTRLARSQELAPLVDRLRFQGIRVIGVQDAFDSAAATADMQAGMSGIMSVEFRKQVRARTHSALETRAKLGRPTGGRCYGYTSQNEPVESEAAIVAEIFERRANGEGLRGIVRDLNARAVPTPHGRPWAVSGVHAMLRNERYIGRLTWNRSMWRKDPDSGKRVRIERPESEWVVQTDERLRLVDDATWGLVRAKDTPTQHGQHHNARLKAPLSGLLLCGECGKPMTLAGGVNSKGTGSRRYVCRTYKEHKNAPGYGCSNNLTVSRAVAEELIIEPLRARLAADPQWTRALAAYLEQRERVADLRWSEAIEPGPGASVGDAAPASVPVSDPAADAALVAKLEALKAAELAGVLTARESTERARVFRIEHERAKAGHLPSDPASILAHAEALQAALESVATDALREALRGVLGTVRCQPTSEGDERYLTAHFKDGDMPLLTWLALGEAASQVGISAMVAGA